MAHLNDDAKFRSTPGHILSTQDLEGYRRQAHYNAIPAGCRFGYDGATPPLGFIWCRGTFDLARYPRLAAIYPSGQLPDKPGEVVKF